MRISLPSSLAAAALCIGAAQAPLAAQTFGSSTPDNAVSPFGRDAFLTDVFGTVAETFTTPAGSPVLQSFTFYLSDFFGGVDLLVQASIFEFAVDHVTGSALFTSAVRSGSSNIFDYDPLTFSGLSLLLTPGTQYAVLLRVAPSSPDGSTNFVGSTSGETFSLGSLFTSAGSSDADLGAAGAFTASDATTFGVDAAIQMTFGAAAPPGAVPEPGSLALLATGLVGIVGFVRRSRQRTA